MPLPVTPVHPEGPRYGAPVLFLPGMWSAPAIWERAAGLLAHRGWEGWLVDAAAGGGGIAARAAALARVAGDLGRPPIVVAQDGAGMVALALARHLALAALVWVEPLLPGGTAVRAAVNPWGVLAGLVFGRAVRRPADWPNTAGPPAWRRDDEAAALVVDVVRGRTRLDAAGLPTALVVGEQDRRCGTDDRALLATRLDAELFVLPGAGVLPLAAGAWQQHTGLVHRWLVHRLGEAVLEGYEEAMAERDQEDE